jgi:large subunit ribosomal protein L21
MYAIIKDGGHQYRVETGAKLQVQLREGLEAGSEVTFDQVCLIGPDEGEPKIGQPFLEGAKVTGKVVAAEKKGPKIDIFFYRRRKSSRRHVGHRQRYTEVQITGIEG